MPQLLNNTSPSIDFFVTIVDVTEHYNWITYTSNPNESRCPVKTGEQIEGRILRGIDEERGGSRFLVEPANLCEKNPASSTAFEGVNGCVHLIWSTC